MATFTTIVLLGFLVLLLIAPFSALAPLMLLLVGSAFAMMLWTFIRTLATGEPTNPDRPSSHSP